MPKVVIDMTKNGSESFTVSVSAKTKTKAKATAEKVKRSLLVHGYTIDDMSKNDMKALEDCIKRHGRCLSK